MTDMGHFLTHLGTQVLKTSNILRERRRCVCVAAYTVKTAFSLNIHTHSIVRRLHAEASKKENDRRKSASKSTPVLIHDDGFDEAKAKLPPICMNTVALWAFTTRLHSVCLIDHP